MWDRVGQHRSPPSCVRRSGRLKTRALAPERTLARVCGEAGATVPCHAMLQDMNLAVAVNDDRAIEVLASGLSLFFGAQLAVDITVRCALAADDTARGCQGRRNRVHQTSGGQGTDVLRTPPWRQVSLGRCRSRNGRKMERGSSPVCGKFGRSEGP